MAEGRVVSGKWFKITLVGEVPVSLLGAGLDDIQLGATLGSGVNITLALAGCMRQSTTEILNESPLQPRGPQGI